MDGSAARRNSARPKTWGGIASGVQRRPHDRRLVVLNADHRQVSPEGRTFHAQPGSGAMDRIGTRYLDDPDVADAERRQRAALSADTLSTGGTAIDDAGVISSGDKEHRRILRIMPDGAISTPVASPRRDWVDAMLIDDAGNLLMPAAPRDRTPGKNDGLDAVHLPTVACRLAIGAPPPRP